MLSVSPEVWLTWRGRKRSEEIIGRGEKTLKLHGFEDLLYVYILNLNQ